MTVSGITWTIVEGGDGYVEMMADITLNGTWSAWSNLYILDPSPHYYDLPITITKKLEDVTTYLYTTGNADSAFPVNYYVASSENQTVCALARPSTGNNNTNYYCRKYIRGKI